MVEIINGGALAPSTLRPLWSTTSALNRHMRIELSSFPPAEDLFAVGKAKKCFNAVLRSKFGRAFVDDFLPNDLFEREAMVVTATRDRAMCGMLHYHLAAPERMVVRGLAVNSRYSGRKIASAMIALAVVHGRIVFGEVPQIECVIRELGKDGGLNERSLASFAQLGFSLHQDSDRGYLTASFRDRHQFPSAEFDESGAAFVRFRRMSAGPDIYPAARDFLADWINAIPRIDPWER